MCRARETDVTRYLIAAGCFASRQTVDRPVHGSTGRNDSCRITRNRRRRTRAGNRDYRRRKVGVPGRFVLADIQTAYLVFIGSPHANRHIDQFEDDERNREHEQEGRCDADELDPELRYTAAKEKTIDTAVRG